MARFICEFLLASIKDFLYKSLLFNSMNLDSKTNFFDFSESRLEFNVLNSFTLYIFTIDKKRDHYSEKDN